MADKPGRHPCSSSDPSSAGAQGGAGNRLWLADASGQEQGADAPQDLLGVGQQRRDCSRRTVGLSCPAFGQGSFPVVSAGLRLGCSCRCVADPSGASLGALSCSRVMLALAPLVKGSHLLVVLHNFSCPRNLHIHPSIHPTPSESKARLAHPWH